LDLLNKLVNHFSESNDEFIIYLETKLYYEYEAKRWFFYWTVDQIAEHEGTMRTTLTTQIQELKTQIKKWRDAGKLTKDFEDTIMKRAL